MDSQNPMLSRSVEDYLKAIYSLIEQGESASTSNIAGLLDVQPSSVSGMIKRLAESGFVEHLPYRGARLTDHGSREALRIVRRHRVLESYLAARLGYSWDDIHDEAERLEHAASDKLIDRMAEALEDPRHDPHGAPIPTRGGEVEVTNYSTLAEADVGEEVEIRAVRDKDAERLRYMEAQGLVPGATLAVEGRAPFDGPVTVRIGSEKSVRTIGFDLARRIFIATL